MIDDLMLIHDDNKAGSGSSAENTLDLKKLFLENIQSAAIDSSADEMKLLPFSRPGGFSKGLELSWVWDSLFRFFWRVEIDRT